MAGMQSSHCAIELCMSSAQHALTRFCTGEDICWYSCCKTSYRSAWQAAEHSMGQKPVQPSTCCGSRTAAHPGEARLEQCVSPPPWRPLAELFSGMPIAGPTLVPWQSMLHIADCYMHRNACWLCVMAHLLILHSGGHTGHGGSYSQGGAA